MSSLYVSTKNRDKLRELNELLGEGVTIEHPAPDDPEVEEHGETLWENALLKAQAGYERSGLTAIGDDTGLEVDALDGAPGVYSSRFAGEDATYADNVRLLLKKLKGVPPDRRSARFRCVIACVGDDAEPMRFDGVLEGTIIDNPRGDNGFGYDPIFLPDHSNLTLAQLGSEEKNRISHRGQALRAFLEWWNSQIGEMGQEETRRP